MESQLFQSMGLNGADPGAIFLALAAAILILLIIVILQGSKISKMGKRLKLLTRGGNADSLEAEILQLFEDNRYITDNNESNRKDIKGINRRMQGVYQKMALVRYDAFHQMGGQLSFCLALLDEDNNGVVLNSVHSTEGSHVYAKEIMNGACEIELGREEYEAVAQAVSGNK